MYHRAFGFAQERYICVGSPDAMGNGGTSVEEPEIVHVLHQSLTVKFLARHRLYFGFENMGMKRGAIRLRHTVRCFHQLDGAALRP